jgi:chemotaxis protein MotB
MARRKRHEEHENHERWLVSYADFITLLFAFFVVMYSTSSINEGKYRVLSDSLMGAFSSPQRSLAPVQVGKLVRSPYQDETLAAPSGMAKLTGEQPEGEPSEEAGRGAGGPAPEPLATEATDPQGEEAPMADVDLLAEKMRDSVLPQIDENLVEVRREADWLEIEMKTSILFASGSARLVDEAIPILENVAEVLKGFPNPVQVEGFTDNVPIRTVAYPSNWELSAARAASVVHLFMKYGVRPERMLAIGYGEHRPVADNSVPDGRSRNRRVVIVIPAGETTRRQLDVERMEERRNGGDSPAPPSGPVATPAPMVQQAVPTP